MDSDINFNSDSTYYSLENKPRRGRKIAADKKSKSEFLNQVHSEILHHWERKKLMGGLQAKQYMIQVSKFKPKDYEEQYFLEKIKSSLLKIYKLGREFEKNSNQKSNMQDSMKNCSLTQDLILVNSSNYNPKQILLKTESVLDSENSFPLELLTNNNFESVLSEKNLTKPDDITESKQELVGEAKSKMQTLLVERETEKNIFSIDLFPSESSKVYVENLLQPSKESNHIQLFLNENKNVANGDEVFCAFRKSSPDVSDTIIVDKVMPDSSKSNLKNSIKSMASSEIDYRIVSSTESLQSEAKYLISSTYTGFNTSSQQKEHFITRKPSELIVSKEKITLNGYNNKAQFVQCNNEKSSNISYKNYILKDDCSQSVSETLFSDEHLDLEQNGIKIPANLNLRQILSIGNLCRELYNERLNKLSYELGNSSLETNKHWRETLTELEYRENLSKIVDDTLSTLFGNFYIDEVGKEYTKITNKTKPYHKFNVEDTKKINMEDLFKRNQTKLDEISQIFREHFTDNEIYIHENHNADFEALTWKHLLM